jgi:uncharacterized membrane protein YbhN (UPF0104 family)
VTLNLRKFSPLLWLGAAVLAAWILWHRLKSVHFADVVEHLRSVSASRLAIALGCSLACYTLVGIYERLAFRFVTGRQEFWPPFRTGAIANPIGRAIGAALFSAGALRYRLYSAMGLNAKQVSAIVVLALMTFVLSVGWLIDISLLALPQQASKTLHVATGTVTLIAVIGLCKDVGWIVLVTKRREPITIRNFSLPLPSLRHTLAQLGIGFVQLSSITGILYAFMPAELNMRWPAFVGVYCIAFVAGQLSNVPAGLGVLEAALLLMLPQVPPAKLMGAVLAYRGVFELLPLIVALVALVWVETARKKKET